MIYSNFKKLNLSGSVFDFINDDIFVALMKESYVPSRLNDKFFSDISVHEIVDPGYAVGGIIIPNRVLNARGDDFVFDGDNVVVNIANGVKVKTAVVYRKKITPDISELVCAKEFVMPKTAIGNTLTVEWSPLGIILLR